MNSIKLTRIFVVVLITALLGGAYLIVAKNDASRRAIKQGTPSGFFH